MQQNYYKNRRLNKLKVCLATLLLLLFALPVMAQDINMNQNLATYEVPSGGLNFYDSGGPGTGAYYQFYEDFTYTFTVESGFVKIVFSELRLNNDHMYIYDGTTTAEANLIVDLTCNDYYSRDYSNLCNISLNGDITVVSTTNALTIHWVSDYHWRDNGWISTINNIQTIPSASNGLKPIYALDKCSYDLYLLPTIKGSTLSYKIGDGNTQNYTVGNPIAGALVQGNTVTAYQTYSEATSSCSVTPTRVVIGSPTIGDIDSQNNVTLETPERPAGVTDTYWVRYTTDGSDPTTSSNAQELRQPGGTINLNDCTPPVTIRAIAHGTTCPEEYSEEVTKTFNQLKVPTPGITFDSPSTGQATLTCAMNGTTILYSINGGDYQEYSAPFAVTAGQTVRAKAVKTGSYIDSDVNTQVYVPGGTSGGSGVYNTIVLLDDREPHTWSYYSDGDQPVHSLNPTDVKITYLGNGKMYTSTTATPSGSLSDATDVQVSASETANQFIYLKTLENNNPEGEGTNYSYTLIPNPFSKRPTFTSGNTTYYTGFYAWRIKSVTGGAISGQSVGDLIIAETEITFQPTSAETGMEVEFEAVWARAFVFTTIANLNNAGNNNYVADANGEHRAYERNFVVVSANVGNTANSRPATITCLNPDGSGTVVARTGGMFTCAADTKFEYINLNNDGGTIVANNHNLCFGRGISTSNRAAQWVRGMAPNNTYNDALNYSIRMESGAFTHLTYVYHDGSTNRTFGGLVQVKAIMGCDYDRANGNNGLLKVCPDQNGNNSHEGLFYSQRAVFSNPDNKTNKTFDCVFKSGQYMEYYWTHDLDGAYDHSVYLGQNSSSDTYPGARHILVEGGEFSSMNGGRGVGGTSTNYCDPSFVTFRLRIKDGLFHGSVFGGAADNPSIGSRQIIITGGEIRGWVAAGANGTGSTSGNSATNGDSYVYVGGNSLVGGDNAVSINSTNGGQVFGAGRGIVENGTPRASSINTSNVVIADNTEISNPGTSGVVGGNVYGGGYNGYVVNTSNVHILGGTIQRNVFGGSYGNGTTIPTSNVIVKGGTINGSVYGGSNSTGTVTNSHVTMSGGEASNVYGGGLGSSTVIGANTEVTVSGGTIVYKEVENQTTHEISISDGNVYGGGEEGTVTGNTNVVVSGGTMRNVYGAGKGNADSNPVQRANIGGNTAVTVSGGTMANVFGGGEAGSIRYSANGNTNNVTATTVTISGGTVNEYVYGGGELGTTQGNVVVNINGGKIMQDVYGGALGNRNHIFVAGLKTVNLDITGVVSTSNGYIGGSVFGGSRKADDYALSTTTPTGTFANNETKTVSSRVNFGSGYVQYRVFGAGYFGSTYGSVYVFIGENAIKNAPHSAASTGFSPKTLIIGQNVFAGADFGSFDGVSFGAPTVSGYSDIYIDGEGYNTQNEHNTADRYMNIGGSVYGCGTSCAAGKGGQTISFKDYGHPDLNPEHAKGVVEPYIRTTRAIYSVQYADTVLFSNSHITFLGQGRINSLVVTEEYAVYEVPQIMYTVNGSSIFINMPIDQVKHVFNGTCSAVYTRPDRLSTVCTALDYNGLGAAGSNTDNKYRVNDGAYLNIYHDKMIATTTNGTTTYSPGYGILTGFAHMMSDDENKSCAYARPKTGGYNNWTGNDGTGQEDYDGGFISYEDEYNVFDADGEEVESGVVGVQMAYENHTAPGKSGEQYFRVWRYGGKNSYREGVFNAHASGAPGTYNTCDVVIELPASYESGSGSYYRIKTDEHASEFTTINYGEDVMTYNAGFYGSPYDAEEDEWMSFYSNDFQKANAIDEEHVEAGLADINRAPNLNFGLVMLPQGSLAGGSNPDVLIYNGADTKLASSRWTNNNNSQKPSFLFRLTYSNDLSTNVALDPIWITFEQVKDGTVTDVVRVKLVVVTSTNIDRTFKTKAYAIMRGAEGEEAQDSTYMAQVTFPTYTVQLFTDDEYSNWNLTNVHWEGYKYNDENNPTVVTDDFTDAHQTLNGFAGNSEFAMTYEPTSNPDQTMGWDRWYQQGARDSKAFNANHPEDIGGTLGRNPTTISFALHYDATQSVEETIPMGTLTFTFEFDNYKFGDETTHTKSINVEIEVIRVGLANRWYLDGIHGDNNYSGAYPNAPMKTLNSIYYRTQKYIAGDEIYIVDKVESGETSLLWDGTDYNGVVIYRYPGGHKMFTPAAGDQTPYYEDYDTENNPKYTGVLVDVTSNMTMRQITLDGYYDGDTHTTTAAAPMVEVQNGNTLILDNSSLLHNYNETADAGAVKVNEGATLNMTHKSHITGNAVGTGKQGAGVYLAGTMVVDGDCIVVNDNTVGASRAVAPSNVYLPGYNNYVEFLAADEDTHIGVTKTEFATYYYTPVAHSENQTVTDYVLANDVVTDDKTMYDVLSLNNTHLEEPTLYAYFVGTWVTAVTWNPYYESREANGYVDEFTAAQLADIHTPQQLAWAISLATGYNGVNNGNGYPATNFKLTGDIDMNDNIWVPIGNNDVKYTGTFDGNGHVVTGLRSPLNGDDMGMFGVINKATIENVVAVANFAGGNVKNMGTIVGTMKDGSVSNCEAAGILTGNNLTDNLGGLVGVAEKGSIHSTFAVNTMTGGATTVMGGLVATNAADLYNSYSNVTMNGATDKKGGLVGVNTGTVENCYVVLPEGFDKPAFVHTNQVVDGETTTKGKVNCCYAASGVTSYVGSAAPGDLAGHGNYAAVQPNIKHLDYLYRDNKVTVVEGQTNSYINTGAITYVNNHIPVWDGLLSVLNQWVRAHDGATSWSRPKNNNVNGDLPVLLFPKDNAMATLDSDGKFLKYSYNDVAASGSKDGELSGFDKLLAEYNANEGAASIFVYGAAEGVTNKPDADVKVTVDEDAVLMPTVADFNATVGVTFDNSCKKASDYIGNTLLYDWHFMSSPLSNAAIGATYGASTGHGGDVNIATLEGSYFPNGLPVATPSSGVKWDLYTYYEPEYHWINLKRSGDNHWHQDNNDQIHYVSGQAGLGQDQNETIFVPGKGYMMAISQDSYMNSTGTLNNSTVSINLTNQEDLTPVYNKGWNLVGNPYQAYLDLSKVGSGSFYIYDADKGVFAPVVDGSSENTDIPSKYIHPHQGFFMYTATDGVTFQFDPSMAGTNKSETGSYYRGREDQVNYPLMNLYAENERGNRDLAVVEFNRPELGGATKVNSVRNANFQIAASLEGQRYGLVFTPEGTERVPVHFITEEDGTFTLTWNTQNGDFTSLLLVDNMTGTITDMLRADRYTFDATTEDYASRFYITYTVTAVDEYNEGDGSFAFFDGSEWVVNGKGQLDIVDVTGRVLFSKRLANERNRVSLNGVANGVYLMRVTDGKNTMVQKIVVR